ncbi:T9SS type A sorting domain-containing protein [Flavobacterium sp.]|uniref:T9SS type A sorting domain-containing protein n=1 Tax=Flavobacterium sp. TaxID=239 RepID=UPI00261C86BE|nr:T9SS type A sorting domain-containing protein [Flavobacterium sp.]
MRTSILFLLLVIFNGSVSAQVPVNSPTPYFLCDMANDGVETYDLSLKNAEILGNLSPNNYTVSYHISSIDANTGSFPLPLLYTNSAWNLVVYPRVTENANPNNFGVTILELGLNQQPNAPTVTVTACSNTPGAPCFDLTSINNSITGGNPDLAIQYFQMQADAYAGSNPLVNPSCYMSLVATPTLLPVYYRIVNLTTGCFNVGSIQLVYVMCSTCPLPNVSTGSITQNGAEINLNTVASNPIVGWELAVQPVGGPPPNQGVFVSASTAIYYLTGLQCGTSYEVYAKTICANNPYDSSTWSGPINFTTTACGPQYGQPLSFQACVDGTNLACFDLTTNNAPLLGTHDPNQHTITYHLSPNEAQVGVNPIDTNFCTGVGSNMVYARVARNDGSYFTSVVFFYVESYRYNTTPNQEYSQCDQDNNGVIVFNLTTLSAQLNSTNTFEYYLSTPAAESQQNPIASPSAFTVNVQGNSIPIYIREIIPNACDTIHIFSIRTFGNCNTASTCQGANSLCGNLGIPFANTVNIASTGPSGCLNTTPNPTWFYMPVSQAGVLNLRIEQNMDVSFFGPQLDVDYAIYGPFTDPLSACMQTTPNTIVSCSYSAATIEYPSFYAQAGKYYLVMVTNFSNSPGYIRISNMGSQAVIDCSGMQFQAFLDSNSNGTMDTGEAPFPLGGYTFELNNDGVIHNYSNPFGSLSIYDLNAANTYDVGFTIQSNYASMYAVNPATLSNLSITPGSGIQNYYFPITVAQAYNDLSVYLVSMSSPRPGFLHTQRVYYKNLGNQLITTGAVNYTKDSRLTLVGLPSGATATTNGLTYGFANLAPFETRYFDITLQVPAVPLVNSGDVLVSTAAITPLNGDSVPTNNDFSLSELVVNAYDPNDKMEAHGREIVHEQFTTDDYLYYTIRFENTGTASAINVRITDELDAQLDETTVAVVASSHSYNLDRIGSQLTFNFPLIDLPVSVANTLIGKGFIVFKVKPRPGFAIGDLIPNTASIYFDFNPPIITNTFETLFVAPLATTEFDSNRVTIYPNPTSSSITLDFGALPSGGLKLEIFSQLGALVTEQTLSGTTHDHIDVSKLESGLYMLRITTADQKKFDYKLVKN